MLRKAWVVSELKIVSGIVAAMVRKLGWDLALGG
jgi:hypothetical protein